MPSPTGSTSSPAPRLPPSVGRRRGAGWRRRFPRPLQGGGLLLVAVATLGCARPGLPVATAAPIAGPQAGPQPWQVPASELATQRLFRLRYDGPEGQGSLRLTLRLATAERYRLTVADVAGRPVSILSVEAGEGLWVEPREETYCRLQSAVELEALPSLRLPLAALPAVLLGRLPATPAGRPPRLGPRFEYRDAEGRRWGAAMAAGEVVSWTLWDGGEPAAWWRRQGDEAILSERRRGVQMRWREVAREPLAELPPPPEIPAGYRSDCGPAPQVIPAPGSPGAPAPEEPPASGGFDSAGARTYDFWFDA